MKRRQVLRILLATLLTAIVVPLVAVKACGPDFTPELFVPAHSPVAWPEYAKGGLGVVQSTYFVAEKVVAFRYLNGGTLDPAEQTQALKVEDPSPDWATLSPDEAQKAQARQETEAADTGVARWLTARLAYGSAEPLNVSPEKVLSYSSGKATVEVTILNCPDAAFDTAVAILGQRAKTAGAGSADLREWLTGQDAVFSNCASDSAVPRPVAASAPVWLQKDRAYQLAAAQFYRGQYTESRSSFEAIGRDRNSPWERWGGYLAARSVVRQAFLSPTRTENDGKTEFDVALLQRAATALAAARTASRDPVVLHAIDAEMDLVAIRLQPDKRSEVLATSLAGPGHDPNFGQHLIDLRWILDEGKAGQSPLLEWMGRTGTVFGETARGASATPYTAEDDLRKWRATPEVPWLVAALMSANPTIAQTPDGDLLRAAASLPASSPAYVTAQFYRARLLLAAKDLPGAREVTTEVLGTTRQRKDLAATNALLGLRMQTAATLAAMLGDAPRTLVSSGSEAATMATCMGNATGTYPCATPLPSLLFDTDAAGTFNTQLPLRLWVEAANSPVLPQTLRNEVAWAAWLRALLLDQPKVASSLLPLLPDNIRTVLQRSSDPTGFDATLVALHAPGLRPFIEGGVPRSLTYGTQSEFRDNWWCQTSTDAAPPDRATAGTVPSPVPAPIFLSPAERAEAAKQADMVTLQANGVVWLGKRVIAFVHDHPDHPTAAEALALVVRATHYACYKDPAGGVEKTSISKEAFTLLHTRYPKSRWAAETPYFY